MSYKKYHRINMKDINELTEEEIANMGDEDFDNVLSILKKLGS